jgi:hypothetical protein
LDVRRIFWVVAFEIMGIGQAKVGPDPFAQRSESSERYLCRKVWAVVFCQDAALPWQENFSPAGQYPITVDDILRAMSGKEVFQTQSLFYCAREAIGTGSELGIQVRPAGGCQKGQGFITTSCCIEQSPFFDGLL